MTKAALAAEEPNDKQRRDLLARVAALLRAPLHWISKRERR